MKLYKYLPQERFENVFAEPGYVTIKCDYPRNYNDPFELFLPFDPETSDKDTLAHFADLFTNIPNLPTACFSRRPDIVPMWAHYGKEQTGFVLELDEAKISEELSAGAFHDVSYTDTRTPFEMEALQYAKTSLKPRHFDQILSKGMTQAYFTKARSWSYEQERRMVVNPKDIHWAGDEGKKLQLLRLPEKCVSAVISGAKVTDVDWRMHQEKARMVYARHFQLRLGRSSCVPFFKGEGGVHLFNETFGITDEGSCTECGEPISHQNNEKCGWCAMDPDAMSVASVNNPLNLLSEVGIPVKISFHGVEWVGREISRKPTPREPECLE